MGGVISPPRGENIPGDPPAVSPGKNPFLRKTRVRAPPPGWTPNPPKFKPRYTGRQKSFSPDIKDSRLLYYVRGSGGKIGRFRTPVGPLGANPGLPLICQWALKKVIPRRE